MICGIWKTTKILVDNLTFGVQLDKVSTKYSGHPQGKDELIMIIYRHSARYALHFGPEND